MERETYFDGYSYQPLSSKVECVQALGKLEDAEEQGRLVVLPCKIGDTIYVIPSETNFRLNKISYPENNRVYEQTVEAILWCRNDRYLVRTCSGLHEALSDDFGIGWFLTRQEAEKALGELKNAER